MYTMQSWTCLFLILCSMQSVCHCCEWIRHHFGHLSSEYLSQLDQMGGDITKQNAPVLFPTSLYRHIDDAEFEDKVRFLNETIYQIIKLFDGNMKSVTWDKKNLDDFLNILERQFENLNSCVSPAMKPESRLKRYFRKLNRKVLRKINYSAEAWELIRKETKRHLQRLDILAGQMY
ncbi:interferon a3 isoform X2 [Salmo salar]|uniref:Interferon a3 isoform X2 n=1 Tax=Salmo salar TaxID=8030 RepID=A0A1S3S6F2_SALSA|nr:interferon a3 isoform X2 [Salmo salar]|eukprot:XP_014059915.1 PREDICTED: interferon a3-like isoform X2 [Salmo salar]